MTRAQSVIAPAAAANAPGLPTVSVIIWLGNSAQWLEYVLHALACQVYPSGLVEVLIVDDSSNAGDSEAVLGRWDETHPFRIRLLRKPYAGAASARNYAVARATGEVLAFTDSDCIPEPNWLLNGVRGLDDGVGLAIGPIIPRRTADTHFFFNSQVGAQLGDTGLYRTANLFVPRPLFDAAGGFDETHIPTDGQATEFGWKIKRSGQRSVFRPDAGVVQLAMPVSIRGWLMRPLRSRNIPRLIRTVPELRDSVLWHRYFYSQNDFFFLVGLGGMVAALAFHWWPLALLALGFVWSTGSSLAGMARKGRLDKAAAMLGLLLARTALNVAVLTYASVRYRRLVI